MKSILILITLLTLSSTFAAAQTATAPANLGDADGGTTANPYQIATLENLYWLSQNSTGYGASKFVQTADIDAAATSTWNSGDGFPPIGSFTGYYRGAGHVIRNLVIHRTNDNVGLFGAIWGNATSIDSLGLENVSITGANYVGGIAGLYNGKGGSIAYCFVTGSITATGDFVGGITGDNYEATDAFSSIITNCYSKASVSGHTYVGGITGDNLGSADGRIKSKISYCYASGVVTGTSDFGGISGRNAFESSVSYCLWDNQTTGQSAVTGENLGAAESIGNIGFNTVGMKAALNFTDAGWNFSTVWQINEGITYPSFKWQGIGALPVELTSFTARAGQYGIELIWSTATEVNNHGFEVERRTVSSVMSQASSDRALNLIGETTNPDWLRIGFVEGNGNSNTSHEYTYVDHSVSAGRYAFRLKQIDRDGKFIYSNIVEVAVADVKQFALEQNYPNPFNPVTTINYQLPTSGHVSLKVFDAVGREVSALVNEKKESGNYTAKFDGSNLSSGIYFYTLRAGTFSATKKFILMK